jgi:hypothetical protein
MVGCVTAIGLVGWLGNRHHGGRGSPRCLDIAGRVHFDGGRPWKQTVLELLQEEWCRLLAAGLRLVPEEDSTLQVELGEGWPVLGDDHQIVMDWPMDARSSSLMQFMVEKARSASALERDAKQGKRVAAHHLCHRANRLCSKKSDTNGSRHSLTSFELRRSVGSILLAGFGEF